MNLFDLLTLPVRRGAFIDFLNRRVWRLLA
jgi:hypothetical protein